MFFKMLCHLLCVGENVTFLNYKASFKFYAKDGADKKLLFGMASK